MKISTVIAMLSTAQAAAITTQAANKIVAEEPMTNEMVEEMDEKIELPNWLVTFNNYLELEDESEFDLDEFLDQLQDEEAQDLSLILYLMEGKEDLQSPENDQDNHEYSQQNL